MASEGRVFGSLADLAHVADVADASKGAALRASVASGTEDVGTVLARVHAKLGDTTDTPIPTAAAGVADARDIEDRIDGVITLAWRMNIMPIGGVLADAAGLVAATPRSDGTLAGNASAGTALGAWSGSVSGALVLPAASEGQGLGLGEEGLGQTVYVAVLTEARRLAEAAISDLGYAAATDLNTSVVGALAAPGAGGSEDVNAWVAGTGAASLSAAVTAGTGVQDNDYCRATAVAGYTFNQAYMNGTGADLWMISKALEEAFLNATNATIAPAADAVIAGANNIHDLV